MWGGFVSREVSSRCSVSRIALRASLSPSRRTIFLCPWRYQHRFRVTIDDPFGASGAFESRVRSTKDTSSGERRASNGRRSDGVEWRERKVELHGESKQLRGVRDDEGTDGW